VEVEVSVVRSISHGDRFQKNRDRAEKAEATRQARWREVRKQEAECEIARLEQQLKWAKERAGQT
jgi:hypothetical protein